MQQILSVPFDHGFPTPSFTLSCTLWLCSPSLDTMTVLSVQVHCSQLWFKLCSFKCSEMPRVHCIVFGVGGFSPLPLARPSQPWSVLYIGVLGLILLWGKFKALNCENKQVITHFLIWYPSAFIGLLVSHCPTLRPKDLCFGHSLSGCTRPSLPFQILQKKFM